MADETTVVTPVAVPEDTSAAAPVAAPEETSVAPVEEVVSPEASA